MSRLTGAPGWWRSPGSQGELGTDEMRARTAQEYPLADVKVVDLSITLPGPYCAQLLRRLGASVIHLEPPAGDALRTMAPSSFAFLSEGKTSVTVDLKSAPEREVARSLLAEADIVIEGWRPGVADRLGVGYRTVAETNPAVVYCSISGFGQTGAMARRPGHDINYSAEAGALDLAATDGLPVGDFAGAMAAALRIVAATWQAARTGRGTWLDVSISGALRDWVDAVGGADGQSFLQVYRMPHYGRFATADGGVLTLGVAHEQRLWDNLIGALGHPSWSGATASERFDRREEMRAYIAGRVATMTCADIEDLFGPVDTCWAIAQAPGTPARMSGRLVGSSQALVELGIEAFSAPHEPLSGAG
jgi:crotonobetainyl-CoA:carnitine CoA-transferase CaiB-like acyl-CoA transferase